MDDLKRKAEILVERYAKAVYVSDDTPADREKAALRVRRLLRWGLISRNEMNAERPPISFEQTKIGFATLCLTVLGFVMLLLSPIADRASRIAGAGLFFLFIVVAIVIVVEEHRKPGKEL
jgi:hypothetical protein